MIEYGSLTEYLQICVLKMAEEGQDLACYIAPIVLRISITTVMFDKETAVSL